MYGRSPVPTASRGTTIRRSVCLAWRIDNDVPEYWEWSGQGVFAFDTSNEAYKLGVNYVIYGMTH